MNVKLAAGGVLTVMVRVAGAVAGVGTVSGGTAGVSAETVSETVYRPRANGWLTVWPVAVVPSPNDHEKPVTVCPASGVAEAVNVTLWPGAGAAGATVNEAVSASARPGTSARAATARSATSVGRARRRWLMAVVANTAVYLRNELRGRGMTRAISRSRRSSGPGWTAGAPASGRAAGPGAARAGGRPAARAAGRAPEPAAARREPAAARREPAAGR